MTSERPDPPRIAEEGPEAPQALRDLVRAHRQSLGQKQGPSAESIARMSERLTAAGVLGNAPKTSLPNTTKVRYFKLGALVLVAAGGWQLSRQLSSTPHPSGAPMAGTRASASIVTGAPIAPVAPEPVPASSPESLDSEPSTMATISVDQLPFADSGTSLAPPVTARAATGESATPLVDNAGPKQVSELELIQRAQATLASAPAQSLAIADAHARAYPHGEFVQEREVIAVEALSRLGRKEESLRRARALVQQFPRTPYAPRLATAVGPSLLPPANRAESTNHEIP